jgi:hypothetical protein
LATLLRQLEVIHLSVEGFLSGSFAAAALLLARLA